MVAHPVLLEVGENFPQCLLPDAADSPCGQVHLVVVGDVTRVLQKLSQPVKLLPCAPGLVSKQLSQLLRVNIIQLTSPHRFLERLLKLVQVLKIPHHFHGLLHGHAVVAEERVLAAQLVHRHKLFHQRGELGHLLAHLGVKGRLQCVLQLPAHLRGHAFHQRLHLGKLLLQHLHQFFEALGRVGTERAAELLHEAVEVRLQSFHFVPYHLVELAHHLLHGRHLLGRHALYLVPHLLGHVLGHLALEHVQQFLELLLGLRVHEVVLHEFLYLAANAFRQGVQLFPVALRPLLQQIVKAFLLGFLGIVGAVDLFPSLFHTPLDAFALGLDYVFQPFLKVIDYRVHVVLL